MLGVCITLELYQLTLKETKAFQLIIKSKLPDNHKQMAKGKQMLKVVVRAQGRLPSKARLPCEQARPARVHVGPETGDCRMPYDHNPFGHP